MHRSEVTVTIPEWALGGGDGPAASAAARVSAARAGAGAGTGTADNDNLGGQAAGRTAGAGPITAGCRGSRSCGTRPWPNGPSVATCVEAAAAATGSNAQHTQPGGRVFGLTTLACTRQYPTCGLHLLTELILPT